MSNSPVLTVGVGGSLPAWRPIAGRLAVISGFGVAGSNSIWEIAPFNTPGYTTLGPKFSRDNSVDQLGINWATAAYTPNVGTFGAYIICSGGHNTYYGNERYVFTLDDRLWRRYGPWGPGDPKAITNDGGLLGIHDNGLAYDTTHNLAGGTTPPFIFDQLNNELGGTTQILVPHEYDMLVWLPPSFGGVGSAGSVMYTNEMYGHELSSGNRAHRWDIAAGIAAGIGTTGIAPGVGWVRACSEMAFSTTGTACVDFVSKLVYAMSGGYGPGIVIDQVYVYDFSAGTGTATLTVLPPPPGIGGASHVTLGGQAASEFWYGPRGNHRLWVQFGRSTDINAHYSAPRIRVYDVTTNPIGSFDVPMQGDVPALCQNWGVCHVPHINQNEGGVFYLKDTRWENNNFIYKITPPASPNDPRTAVWTWTAQPMLELNGSPMQGDSSDGPIADPNVGMSNGWYKRLRYATNARCILINTRSNTTQKLYAWTPPEL